MLNDGIHIHSVMLQYANFKKCCIFLLI